MKHSTLITLILTIVCNAFIWSFLNTPHSPSDMSFPLQGLSFTPYKKHQSPYKNPALEPEALLDDLRILNGKANLLRLYSSNSGIETIPELATREKLPFRFVVSANLESYMSMEEMDREVEAAIHVTGRHRNVERMIIGNETQLTSTIPAETLIHYLQQARTRLKTPVSTSEPWDYWLEHPELADEVDYLAVHILPYWVGIPVEEAVDYVFERYGKVKETFPGKMVMIAETGWPSDGPQRGGAEPSQTNQAFFVREFSRRANAEGIRYNIVEAFDQPWKDRFEGRTGEHWGILDADRQEKFPLKGPVLEDPNWTYWMCTSILVGFLSSLFFLFRRRELTWPGQFFSIVLWQLSAAFITQLAREIADQYMSPGDIVFWGIMIAAQILLAIIILTDAAEIVDVVGRHPLKFRFLPHCEKKEMAPFVSIHVACSREPPEMVIATINSLALLDYPNFEVLIVDNNTPDPAMWQPVQARCMELGERFRFFTLGTWPGFKSGALNFALRETSPQADLIAIVDADYIVESNWLRATIPYFDDPDVAVVQAPQEHRDWNHNLFRKMANDEYSGFFRIGMVQRNEHNAIIQHGTMTVIRKETLIQVGRWAEWCICEDAELGLRIINERKKMLYIDHPFGRGLVPDSYEAYTRQRFRWTYGAMRILRRHWKKLVGLDGNLTAAQRYHFVKGWLPWIGDGMHMIFTLTALLWSAILLIDPLHTDFPEPIFIYPALALVLLRITGTIATYVARVKIGIPRTIMAMIAGGSLTHKVAKAVVQGLLTNNKPFIRTPKLVAHHPLLRSLFGVREELVLGGLLVILAGAIIREFGMINDYAMIWAAALVTQTFPYWSAVIAAIVAAIHRPTPQFT